MMPAEYDVTGKVVFITGAGRGIGKGIAQVLAEAGADVALNALTPKYVEGTAAQIAAASGRRVVPVIADVTKSDEVRRAVDALHGHGIKIIHMTSGSGRQCKMRAARYCNSPACNFASVRAIIAPS